MAGFTYLINLNVMGGNALDRAIAATARLGGALDHVQAEAGQAGRAMGNAGRRGASAFDSARSSLSGWVAGLGIAAAGGSILKMGADAEQTALSFEVMLKSADKARALVGQLNEFANVTPFTNDEVLKGGKNLVAFGFDASSIVPTLRMVGDVASGLNIPLEEMSSIFGKMKVRNFIQAEELDLMTDRGVPIITELAKVLGVADSQVYKLASDSEITFAHLTQAFQNMTTGGGQFAGMMERQAETLGGKWSTFLGQVQVLATTIGNDLLPIATSLLNDYFIPAVTWVSEHRVGLEGLAVVFGSLYVATRGYALYTGIAAIATSGFTGSVWGLNAALLWNPLTWVVGGVIALGAAVVWAWNRFDWFRAGVYGVWEVIKPLAGFLWDYLILPFRVLGFVVQWVWEKTEGLRDWLWGLGDTIKQVGKWVWEHLIKPFTVFGQVFTLLEKAFNWAAPKVQEKFTEGWNQSMANDWAKDNTLAIVNEQAGGSPMNLMMPGGKNPMANDIFNGKQQPPYQPDGGGKGDKAKSGLSGMGSAGGGRNVTINNKNLVENIVLHVANVKEGADEIKTIVIRALQEVLNSGNQAQTATG